MHKALFVLVVTLALSAMSLTAYFVFTNGGVWQQ